MKSIIFKFDNIEINNIDELISDSLIDGFNFVKRTKEEWLSLKNDFSRKGEVFYGIKLDDKIVAIGELNIDPYLNNSQIGRVRHVYVHRMYRRQGLAHLLMNQIILHGKQYFRRLTLRTNNPIAIHTYEKYGFSSVMHEHYTHELEL